MYNPTWEKYVLTQQSVQNQTNKNYEWIVVDDGSDDPNYFSTVQLFNNYGPSVARNVGFQISKGDIITYLDIGDELYKGRIEHIIEIFTKFPKTQLLFDSYSINSGEITNQIVDHMGIMNYYKLSPDNYLNVIQSQNISIPLGVSHRRKPFVEVGGFQRGIVCGEDGILWRRMVDKLDPSAVVFSNHLAGVYYISETGQSRTQRRFEEGGFAFDAGNEFGSNGQYLDKDWFETYNSKELFDV